MYMAPEQLRGEEVDGRTDLYAAGAVLFELVTGRMAFEAESDYALMMKQLNEPPPAASSLVREIPTAIDAIIQRAMAKRREDRFPHAGAFREALEGATDTLAPPSRRTPVPAETRLAAPSLGTPTPADGAPRSAGLMQPDGGVRYGSAADSAAIDHDVRATAEAVASHHAPPTRLAADAHVASHRSPAPPIDPGQGSGGRPLRTGDRDWMRDWRTFAVAGALFVSAGLVVRTLRPAPAERDLPGRTVDSVAVVALDRGTNAADSAIARPREEASALLLNAPAVTVRDSARGSGGGTGDAGTGGGTGRRPPRASAPPVAGGTDRPAERGERPPVTPVAPPSESRTEPTRPDPVPAPRDEGESEATAIANIRDAITSAAASLSGRSTGTAESLLGGSLQEQWITLMKEGRISLSPSGAPSVQLRGTRASAEFEASVNVRSPFGANKRRGARFAAELSRGGSGWRVTSLRPLGGLELK
jgi:serine/threonine-protein kinase